MSKKTTTSTSQVAVPPEVLANYNAVNAQAAAAADNPFQSWGSEASDFVAPINAQQQMGIDNTNAVVGSYQPYIDAATGATNYGMGAITPGQLEIDKYMSPYISNVADTTGALIKQQQEEAQAGQLGTAISSGAFGGDRAGVAAANLEMQNAMAYGKSMADIYQEGYGQALGAAQQQQAMQLAAQQENMQRMLAGGQQLAGLGATSQALGLQGAEAQINAGTLQQQTEQAGKDALINQFMQEQGYPFQVAQFMADIYSTTGPLSGSTTTTTQPAPFFASGGAVRKGYEEGGPPQGPYGRPVGSNPGISSYIPRGYLRTPQMLIADPGLSAASSDGISDYISKMIGVGEGIGKIYDIGGKMFPKKAEGGSVNGLTAGYMTPILEHTKDNDKEVLKSAEPAPPPESTFGKLVGLGTDIAKIAMLKNGGSVRKGYYDGGATDEEDERNSVILPLPLVEPGLAPVDAIPLPKGEGVIVAAEPGPFERARKTAGQDVDWTKMTPEERESYGVPINEAGLSAATRYEPANKQLDRLGPMAPVPAPAPGLAPVTVAPATTAPAKAPISIGELASEGIGAVQPEPGLAPPVTVVDEPLEGNMFQQPGWEPGKPGYAPAGVNPGVDTGVGGGTRPAVIPIKTQVEFAMTEPDWEAYASRNYRTPGEAAIGFDTHFERSGGKGNDRAAIYATDIHNAAMSGDMSKLPPNVQEVYNTFISKGVDPILAAGATGRFMVESYAHIDPNARNTIGGGHGTYGIAQWRGPRMEALADFAGVPLSALTGQPVSTPEGRYYSDSASGSGLGNASGNTRANSQGESGLGAALGPSGGGGGSPWDMFKGPNGGLSRDTLLSIMSGLGTMASSPSRFLGSAILQGIGGGATTFMNRQEQNANIAATNIETLKKLAEQTMTMQAQGADVTMQDVAKMTGYTGLIPDGSTPASILSGDINGLQNPTDLTGQVSYNDKNGTTTRFDGAVVNNMDDPAFLQQFINQYGSIQSPTIQSQVDVAKTRLAEIHSTGYTKGKDASGNIIQVPIPEIQGAIDDSTIRTQNREASSAFETSKVTEVPVLQGQLSTINGQIGVYSQLEGGVGTTAKAKLAGALQSIGLGDIADAIDTNPALVDAAIKSAAQSVIEGISAFGGQPPAGALDQIASMTANPDMQPAAIRYILAMKKAGIQQRLDYYNKRNDPSLQGRDAYDLNGYAAKFYAQNPIEGYIERNMATMPALAGPGGGSDVRTNGSSPAAPGKQYLEGTTATDTSGRPIIFRNGAWAYQ